MKPTKHALASTQAIPTMAVRRRSGEAEAQLDIRLIVARPLIPHVSTK